jgi:hypothetical protein
MQQRVVDGYSDAGRASRLPLHRSGVAWAEALMRRPQLSLWAGDGTHPSRAGSYLAACVFETMLTHRTPVGNRFTDGLDLSLARFLQRVAWDAARKRY